MIPEFGASILPIVALIDSFASASASSLTARNITIIWIDEAKDGGEE